MDSDNRLGHSRTMNQALSHIGNLIFYLAAAIWFAIAIPVILLSLFLMEMPFWPNFTVESTPEGIALWAALAGWFYIAPVVLIIIGRRRNGRSTSKNGHTLKLPCE